MCDPQPVVVRWRLAVTSSTRHGEGRSVPSPMSDGEGTFHWLLQSVLELIDIVKFRALRMTVQSLNLIVTIPSYGGFRNMIVGIVILKIP